MPDTTNISGGVNITGDASAGGDIIGRDKIVQGAPDPLAQYFHQLPPPPSDFVGREDEQRDLLNTIERGAVITGLHGLGGIGKTALALVIAHQLKEHYRDAQFFLDLRGAGDNPVTPLEALTHVVRAYYPTSKLPDNLPEMQALYQSVLEGRQALLLFDNAKDAQQIIPLLPPTSCLLLITSRFHFTVPGLKARDLNVLPPDKARELLLGIADRLSGVIPPSAPPPHSGGQGVSPAGTKNLGLPDEILRRFAAQDDKPLEVVNFIAYLCGYLPQALRASASLLAETIDLDPIDFVRQLSDERQRLQRIGVDPARDLDVEASLNLSYKYLPLEAQRVLAQLSVFPSDFDAGAEEAVCDDEGHTQLSLLVKWSLVQYNPPLAKRPPASQGENATPLSLLGRGAGGEGRYSLHDLVRLFAAGRLSDDERTAAQRQHAEHYKKVLSTADDFYLKGSESIAQGLALFDREWVNIQAGQQWAVTNAQDDDEAAQLCNAYPDAGVYVLDLRLHPRDKIRWLQDALHAAQHLQDRKMEGVHLGNLGNAYADLGETRQAIEFYEQQLIIVREIGDRRGEGNALGNLGIAYADLGETRKAIEFYEQHLDIAREIGDRRGEGNALGNLGNAYAALGETRQAIESYEQVLVIMQEIGDRRGEGNALGNLGIVHKNLGETRKAIEFYEQYHDIAREIGDRRGESIALWNMALALDELGEREQAIAHAEAALKIYEAVEDPHAGMVRRKLAEWKGDAKQQIGNG